MKTILLLTSVLFLTGCVSQKEKETTEVVQEEKRIPVLDIEGQISASVPDTFTWNSIASRVHIIPLSNRVLLTEHLSIRHISKDLDLILITDDKMDRVVCFDGKGKVKNTFRNIGQGPGEYKYLTNVWFNQLDSTIQVFDNNNRKWLSYTMNGKFLTSKMVNDKPISHIRYIDKNGKMYVRGTSDANYLIHVITPDWEVEKSYIPFDSTYTVRQITALMINMARSNNKDRFIDNLPFNDTIFVINEEGRNPSCILKKGSHALPEKECENFLRLPKGHNYFLSTNIDIFSHYLLYSYVWKDKLIKELWDLDSKQKIALQREEGDSKGINFVFPSGNMIRTIPEYITNNQLGFLLPADQCVGEVEGVKEDDNQVLLVLDLR